MYLLSLYDIQTGQVDSKDSTHKLLDFNLWDIPYDRNDGNENE